MLPAGADLERTAVRNTRLFIAFRILFNARFYYPVFAVLFLDLGLTLQEFALVNVVWALSIIVLEVPSGAVADQVGRKKLVVAASLLMVIEILLVCLVPIGHSGWTLAAILVNRVLSGAAEAAASGADEALAYDSLVAAGHAGKWPHVLETLMRYQAVAFVVANLVGAAVYHAPSINFVLAVAGLGWEFPPGATMRFPLFLTLGMALGAVVVSLRMREPEVHTRQESTTVNSTLHQIRDAANWVAVTPAALALIVAALVHDSFVRLFLTVQSSYLRLIGIPEVAYGLIGACFAVLGFFIAPVGRKLVGRFGAGTNFLLVSGLVFGGLLGVGRAVPAMGVVFIVPLGAGFFLLNFFVSKYLNEIVDSGHRATVLSFKSLAMNLAYAGVGGAFAILVQSVKSRASLPETEDMEIHALGLALPWVPWAFLCAVPAIIFFGWRARKR